MYLLAQRFILKGTVSNNEEGVIIYTSGLEEDIYSFYKEIVTVPPKVAKIKGHTIEEVNFKKFDSFQIIPSEKSGRLNLPLTPDFAICDDCKNEISDTQNRRYLYPFTTCVNCGPRWAITETFPFERNHTSIDKFPMGDVCLNEYTDPLDRRFHSQTNTCHTCGIDLYLTDSRGDIINFIKQDLFKEIASLLLDGNIIAIKNTSGYLLCCNAENQEVVQNLRDKKNRPNKPFAILYPSLNKLKSELNLEDVHLKSLSSTELPITIVPSSNYRGKISLKTIAPGINQLGVMLPYSAVLQLLANELSFPIVATSGNIHGAPIISDNKEAIDTLNGIADYFLQHDLDIVHPQDDSVVKFSNKFQTSILLRRSRGYAPNFFNARITSEKKIMALGGHLKSSIAFYPNEYLYISQYLGNLDNYDVYERFTKTAANFIDLFQQNPTVLLVDKHPTYQSTLYGNLLAKENEIELFKVQHHKAHFASVLGEHGLFEDEEAVLGVIWDGTGYGDDGQIWGGEFFKYQVKNINRISHFSYFDWLAGDKMSKEPRLSFFSLSNSHHRSMLEDKFSGEELAIYEALKSKNKLKTSSVGRLFDAVASLLNICDYNTYEGEAAILLESYVTDYNLKKCTSYCTILDPNVIPTEALFNTLFLDVKNGNSKENIITNFLFTLATIIFQVAKLQSIKRIACSGGVFQNTVLIDMLNEMATDEYKLYFNRNLSPNDENISFGQLMFYTNLIM